MLHPAVIELSHPTHRLAVALREGADRDDFVGSLPPGVLESDSARRGPGIVPPATAGVLAPKSDRPS